MPTVETPSAPAQANSTFLGFDSPSANFTPVPNQYFDCVLGHWPLRVVTVVGILVRSTLGWHDNVTGERRIEAELPLSAFFRPELAETAARRGLREAIEAGFIVETAAPTNREGGRYALRWADPSLQREAVIRQRRAIGDARPLAQSLSALPEGLSDSGGSQSGPPECGPPECGPPQCEPPTIKKRSLLKKNVLIKKTPETLNVSGKRHTHNNSSLCDKLEGLQEPATDERIEVASQHLSEEEQRSVAVRSAIAVTEDAKSAARFSQLFNICRDEAEVRSWDDAIAATIKAKAKGGVRGSAGAYFNGTLAKILQKRGIYVPVGNSTEREVLQGEISASLGLPGPAATQSTSTVETVR